ncbi:MAG: cyclic nucleotide-binding domain-containing protein [Proteobacteria bacterium]|nr:cyclic nucleotide-binding domain-containing protein [Pseudomonadota bacterium]MBU1716345.1 cyclic nucleotide-binding domain-containing protein [Pseudomonadota bacterium]
MNIDQRVEYLSNIDLFEFFSKDDLRCFAESIKEVELAENDILFREGSPGLDMFILLKGSLKLYKETRFITVIKPVDYIGEMAIIESKPRSATVQATAPSLLLQITSKQFKDYLARQPESLVSMMRTLSQRIRKNTEIIAGEFEKANILIHDMKNLMSSFLFLDLLEKQALAEAPARYVKVMKNGRDNLLQMMEEALANAKRLNRPRLYSEASISELVKEVMESEVNVHPDLQDKDVRVKVVSEPQIFPFNKLEIRRVLVNLLINAAQASDRGGRIDIEIESDGQQAMVRIIDNGQGVPVQYREKIFQTHFTTKDQGNGLGLASCKHVIEKLHGGELTFTPRPEGGTIFSFSLPFAGVKDIQ